MKTEFSIKEQRVKAIRTALRSPCLSSVRRRRTAGRAVILFCAAALTSLHACAGIVTDLAADSLAGGGQTYASDDDPDLVRDALPFALKTTESLLEGAPTNTDLLLTAASGFTQYAYAFVQQDAEHLDATDPQAAKPLFARARRMYARARRYGFRGLEARHEDFRAVFSRDRDAALAETDKNDVPFLYWTAVAWAAQISISKADLALVGDVPDMEAMMDRALALDEKYDSGAIHEFYVAFDGGRSESDGGGVSSAKKHFDSALKMSKGKKVAPFVTWAEVVSVKNQNRKEFDEMLDKALAFDVDEAPQFRLVNLIAQQRARRLKDSAGDLFWRIDYHATVIDCSVLVCFARFCSQSGARR